MAAILWAMGIWLYAYMKKYTKPVAGTDLCTASQLGLLLPVLEIVINQFLFQIEGFHSDNGSEYINYKLSK
jgi:hypothetical protein